MKNELETLEAAKAETKRLDRVRDALPDNAPASALAKANAAYFAAIEAQGAAQDAYNKAIATPEQLAAREEQSAASKAQLDAHMRLLAKDARTPGIAKTMPQLDAEYDAELIASHE